MKYFFNYKIKKSFVLTLMFTLITFVALNATDYYVSADGDDSNDGSESSPWASIEQATSQATSSGDVIYLAERTFPEDDTCHLEPGVSILGAGMNETVKNSSVDKAIRLESSAAPQNHCNCRENTELKTNWHL